MEFTVTCMSDCAPGSDLIVGAGTTYTFKNASGSDFTVSAPFTDPPTWVPEIAYTMTLTTE